MKRMAPLVLVALLAACSTSSSSPDLLVSVYSGSETKAAFVPRPLQPLETTIWLTPESAGRTAKGEVISGFRFAGARVSEGARVRVYALTSRSFTTRPDSVVAVRIADYTVGSGSEVQIEAMSALGVTPMTLRVEFYNQSAT